MPPALRDLRLAVGHSPADWSAADSFFARLAQTPLRSLRLELIPVSPTTLGRLLDGTGRWQLRKLSLLGCDLTEDHARALALSPGLKGVHSLDLSGNWHFGGDAVRTFFSSEHLHSVVDLNLSGTAIGTDGAVALAGAQAWHCLRWLDLSDAGLGREGLRALLTSPNVRNLTWLRLGEGGYQGAPSLGLSPDLAVAITQLPHLASLRLDLSRCDPRSKQVLSQSDSLAWAVIQCYEEDDVQTHRANRASERWPPVDAALER
jgi:hypothetical protein